MNKISILNNFNKNKYYSYPFPFFYIDRAFDQKIYDFLKKDYILFHKFFQKNTKYKKNNIRLQMSTEEFYNSKLFLNSIWYDFVEYHTSKTFFLELVEIFRNDMIKIYPRIIDMIDKNKDDKNFLNIRTKENISNFQFVADCQPGINTPCYHETSVRQSHLDNSAEIFAGLFYLRDDNDRSSGGNLQVMEVKNKKKINFHQKSEVKNQFDLDIFKEVKYEKNKVIFFLNTKNSIHNVTSRSETNLPRNLTNIIFESYSKKIKTFSLYNDKKNLILKLKKVLTF